MTTQIEYERGEDDRKRRSHVGCGGAVVLAHGRLACQRCGAVDDNAGWRKKLLTMNWHWHSLDGYPRRFGA